jgi:hypothetical protein
VRLKQASFNLYTVTENKTFSVNSHAISLICYTIQPKALIKTLIVSSLMLAWKVVLPSGF